MDTDPASLDNLRDIVVPEPVSWWPLAPGWILLTALVLVLSVLFGIRRWKQWRANAYRRDALRMIEDANAPAEIATILKRTALAAYPRSKVASLTGDAWCDWLEEVGPAPIEPSARDSLVHGIYGEGELDLEAARRFAKGWVKDHEAPTGEAQPC